MQFFDLVEKRRSIRAFQTAPLPAGALERILHAVRMAPSAGNLQAFRFAVIVEPEVKAALAKAAKGQTFLTQAPVVLAFFCDPRESAAQYGPRGAQLYAPQDAAIAVTFAHLAAADLGLGSVWVGAFDTEAVRRVLACPAELEPVALLPIGVPAEVPAPGSRKALEALQVEVG